MSDDVQKFLEAVHGRLQALSLAGVTLVPRLLPKSLPSTAASSSENAATTGAKPAAPSATPGNGHSWKDVIGHMKAELSKAGAKASAAQPATAKPGATRPAALPTVPPPRTRAAAPAPAASAAQATPPAPATQPSVARATPSAGESGEDVSLRPTRTVSPQTAQALADLAATVAKCTRCPELARTRTQTVFCSGTSSADVMFIGEAPGEDEDLQGEAFVGRAGQLLTKIITGGMKMRRQDVYICNILKCRPPGNRQPQPDEAARCREFLDRQIELVSPRVICLLGGIASHFLLDDNTPVGRMRGRWFDYRGIPVRVTYHPAYLLRNYTAEARKKVWDDVLEVVRKLRELRQAEGI